MTLTAQWEIVIYENSRKQILANFKNTNHKISALDDTELELYNLYNQENNIPRRKHLGMLFS